MFGKNLHNTSQTSVKSKPISMPTDDKEIIATVFNKYFPNIVPLENRLGFGVYVNFSPTRKDAFISTTVLEDNSLAIGLIRPLSGKATNKILGFRLITGPWTVSNWSNLTVQQKQVELEGSHAECKNILNDFIW